MFGSPADPRSRDAGTTRIEPSWRKPSPAQETNQRRSRLALSQIWAFVLPILVLAAAADANQLTDQGATGVSAPRAQGSTPRADVDPGSAPGTLPHGNASGGTVELPRTTYDSLVDSARSPHSLPAAAPIPWALGKAKVRVDIDASGRATITAEVGLRVFEDGWTLVPLLPGGTAIDEVKIDGRAVQLTTASAGLAWSVRSAGQYAVHLRYRADASSSEDGYDLAVPLPRASSVELDALLPEAGLDVAVIPSAGRRVDTVDGRTRVNAALPSTSGVFLSWRRATDRAYALSRADYRGRLEGGALRLEGRFDLEIFADGALTLPLLPSSITLSSLEVDGKPAPILVQGEKFATLVQGKGHHTLLAAFEVPVSTAEGPPSATVFLPAVPVSGLELDLPGKKDVDVQPASSLESLFRNDRTLAKARVPMTGSVQIRWTEAVPEDVKAELRANAGLYHAFWAEEGVLFGRLWAEVEITRGATSTLSLEVPSSVQMSSVRVEPGPVDADEQVPSSTARVGSIQDWRLSEIKSGNSRELEIFFDHSLEGRLLLDLQFDTSLLPGDGDFQLPLLRLHEAQRQRGMIVLLQGRERVLEPLPLGDSGLAGNPTTSPNMPGTLGGSPNMPGTLGDPSSGMPTGGDPGDQRLATRVGENQLPAFVRGRLQGIDGATVAHTFKYVEPPTQLRVQASTPERQQGRFDVLVDTLVSLAEVSLGASATVEVDVKSGSVSSLQLLLPPDTHLLGLSGPSIRHHTITPREDLPGQLVNVELTQEMEGQFRLDITYEHLLVEGASQIPVPVLGVPGAEIEQGRMAVEALSAVEVQPAVVEQLSVLDVAELPRSLILRTTNPILHAYKYVGKGRNLELQLTRHRVVDVQEAAIDQAVYRTLFTRAGLSVTHAHFQIRNSREQFLRLRLPAGSKVWSAFVDGKPEKPARASDPALISNAAPASDGAVKPNTENDQEAVILIRILHSTRGFPVELIYETPAPAVRGLGTIRGTLPRPEILVTQSRWEVWVPDGVDYRQPGGEMELAHNPGSESEARNALTELGDAMAPLRLEVPRDGVRFVFEKLYANRVSGDVGFELPYVTGSSRVLGRVSVFLGTLLAWGGIALWMGGRRRHGGIALGIGLGLVTILVMRFSLEASTAILASCLTLVCMTLYLGRRFHSRRRARTVEPVEPVETVET